MLIHADILEWCKRYDGPRFHALLCDPPYHLTEITKRFGKADSAPAQYGKDGAFQRASKGFMGKQWDGGDLAFRPELWAALADLLHPGAFGMAFASTRGYHRMACAIEDAGFVIHPIICWAQGQGFPKATRIGERVRVNGKMTINEDERFSGHRYGLQALSPSIEPLAVFHKPITISRYIPSIAEITALTEMMLCIVLSVPDAESLTHRIHQKLQAVVEHFAQSNADVWELLKTVTFAGRLTGSSLAGSTLRDFVAAPAPTSGAMHQQAKTTQIGQAGATSVKAMSTSDEMVRLSRSIGRLWSNCLEELCELKSTCIIETATSVTTDLRTYKLLVSQIIHDFITKGEQHGSRLYVLSAVECLTSVLTKLPSLNSTIAPALATEMLAEMEQGQAVDKLSTILLFQKPYEGRPIDCITATGAGALNIDAGRIGRTADDRWEYGIDGDEKQTTGDSGIYGRFAAVKPYIPHDSGRWPANLVLSHDPDCTADQCTTSCAVWRLGQQSGESTSKASDRGGRTGYSGLTVGETNPGGFDDSGTAARYFFNSDWTLDRLEAADPLFYTAKSSTAEREAGLADFAATTVDDGRQTPIDNPYLRGETTRRNTHATVKPLSLTRWLASLLLPPVEYAPRRLLIPFGGVASEMIGAHLAGWEEVTGIELEAEHVAIGQARLAWWREMARKLGTDDPATILEMAEQVAEATTIFDLMDAA